MKKKEIHKEVRPISQHLERWWDWCVLEDEKQQKNRQVSKVMRVVASNIKNKTAS